MPSDSRWEGHSCSRATCSGLRVTGWMDGRSGSGGGARQEDVSCLGQRWPGPEMGQRGECGGGAFQRFEEVKIVKTQWYKERAESEMPSCF